MNELTGTSFIGWDRGAKTSTPFRADNRLSGETLDPDFFPASQNELEQAAMLAESAAGSFARSARSVRSEFLRAIASELDAIRDQIVPRARQETALPEARLVGELARTTGQIRFFADLIDRGDFLDVRIDRAEPDRQPLPKPEIRSMRRAVGPVAVFGASNFPLAFSVCGGDTASALAAGCPVIVKAHRAHPGTSELAAEALVTAARGTGMPEGVFSMLFDEGIAIGQALVSHPAIQAVGFTGSQRGGMALLQSASQRKQPIPVFAEMGSVNPMVFMPGRLAADPEGLARGLCASATVGVGQFCTNPGVVFLVGKTGRDSFLRSYVDLMRESVSGTMLSAGIGACYLEGARGIGSIDGVETLVAPDEPGSPAVFSTGARAFIEHPNMQEEVFGPATLLVNCEAVQDAASAIQAMAGQLTGSIHGIDEDWPSTEPIFRALESKVGRLLINQFPTGLEVCDAVVHGGPFPATTDCRFTSVGGRAIERWLRPVCYQNVPQALLPADLRD